MKTIRLTTLALVIACIPIAFGQTATPTPTPTPPFKFPITETFGYATDGTALQWKVWGPSTLKQWPPPADQSFFVVMAAHGGGFHGGGINVSNIIPIATDMAAKGYITISIPYRLCCKGSLPGQTSAGNPPDQVYDVEQAITTAESMSWCKALIFYGDSAGGSHGAYAAVDVVTRTDAPAWTAADRPLAVACFSGAYDLSLRTPENYPAPEIDPMPGFIRAIDNYTTYSENSAGWAAMRIVSPIGHIPSADIGVPDIYLINSQYDSMPFHQLPNFTAALDASGITNYIAVTVPGDKHAFDNYPDPSVHDAVVQWTIDHFNNAPPKRAKKATPTPTQTNKSSPSPTPKQK